MDPLSLHFNLCQVSPLQRGFWPAPCHPKWYPIPSASSLSILWASSIFSLALITLPNYEVLIFFLPDLNMRSVRAGIWAVLPTASLPGPKTNSAWYSASSTDIFWWINGHETTSGNLTQIYVAGDEVAMRRRKGCLKGSGGSLSDPQIPIL